MIILQIWFQNKRAKTKKQNNQPTPLRGLLVAGGLYNHSTLDPSDCESYEDDEDDEDRRDSKRRKSSSNHSRNDQLNINSNSNSNNNNDQYDGTSSRCSNGSSTMNLHNKLSSLNPKNSGLKRSHQSDGDDNEDEDDDQDQLDVA